MVTKAKTKQIFDVKTVDTPSDLVAVNDSQLGLFDYGNIAKKYNQETADQLQSLQYEGNGILTDAKVKFGNVLRKGKALVDHGDFENWYSTIWGLIKQRANDFMKIAEAHEKSPESGLLFPEKLQPASTMAKAILGVNEEKREELIDDFKQEKETKGKDLTEAEIKKLAERYLKEKDEQIELLNEQLQETKQTSLFYEQEASKKLNEVNQLKETVDNQTKDIQEKNSKLSQLVSKENELKEKEEKLNKIIAVKVEEQVEEKTEQELERLAKERKELEKAKAQISKELKEVQDLKRTAQRQKDNLDSTQEWITNFQLTNEFLAEATNELKKYKNNLQKNPNLSELEEKDRTIVEEKIKNLIVDFNDNLHSLGGAINYLNGAVVKFNNTALRVLDAEVVND